MGVWRTIMAVLALTLLAPGPASAQLEPPAPLEPAERAALEAEFESTFQAILDDPGKLDLAFHYAILATRLGNFEAAIGSLERMLLFNPDLPRVRLELGVLYFRLGSYSMARSYFERATAGEDVPDEVHARVAAFLAEIEKRQSSHQFGGSVFVGGRFQSNANAGPSGVTVKVFGLDATLDDQFTRQDDFNAFGALTLRHSYDFQSQSGVFMESDVNVYAAEQDKQSQLNLVFLEATSGPRFAMFGDGSIRPYALTNMVTLDRDLYFWTIGGGLQLTKRLSETVKADANLAVKKLDYDASLKRPLANGRDATDILARAGVQILVAPDVIFSLGGSFRDLDAKNDINSYQEWVLSAGVAATLKPLAGAGPWLVSLNGARVWSDYEDLDPTIDPDTRRKDREWRVNLSLTIPVAPAWAIVGTVGHLDANSSLPNFAFRNTTGSLGVSFIF